MLKVLIYLVVIKKYRTFVAVKVVYKNKVAL